MVQITPLNVFSKLGLQKYERKHSEYKNRIFILSYFCSFVGPLYCCKCEIMMPETSRMHHVRVCTYFVCSFVYGTDTDKTPMLF